MKRSPKFLFILIAIFVFALTTAGSALADNHASDCMIPEMGPWPPCATGGEATDEWNSANTSGSNSGSADCMIPESGPWPACATGGAAAGGNNSDAGNAGADSDSGMAANSGTTLLGSMEELEFLLEQMGGLLDRLHAGSAESCTEFMSYYLAIAALPVYEDLPAEWNDLHNLYIDAAVSALESNKDIFLICEGGGGTPSDLNYGVARTGINDSLSQIKAGIAVASEMADAPPAPPAAEEPAAEEGDAADDAEATEEPVAEETPAPAEPTPMPAEPTPAPADPTPAPVEPTPAPADPVRTPRQPPTEAEVTAVLERLYGGDYSGPRGEARVFLDIPEIDGEGVLAPPSLQFDPLDFVASTAIVAGGINNMGGLIDRLLGGSSSESCLDYLNSFVLIAISPQFTDVPAYWQGMVTNYESAIHTLLDTNKDFLLNACVNGGAFSEFNFWRARDGIDTAAGMINPVFEQALTAYMEGY